MMHDRSQNDTRTRITNPGPDPEANTNGACIFDPIEAVLLLYTIPVPIGGFGHTIPVLVSAISVEFIPEGRGEEGAELYPAKANHAELSEGVRSAPLELDDERVRALGIDGTGTAARSSVGRDDTPCQGSCISSSPS